MNREQLEEIRYRVEAATPGPWSMRDGWGPTMLGEMRFRRIATADHVSVIQPTEDGNELEASQADAEFIAHARTDVPALLDEIDRLTAELAEAHNTIVYLGSGGAS